MKLALSLLVAVAGTAFAQSPLQTEFPPGATQLEAEALQKLLTGKTFLISQAVGSDMRIQYKESFVFINIGQRSDSGEWRAEGSTVCIDWRTLPKGCSEVRTKDDTIYLKRTSNNEVVVMKPQ